MVLPATTTGNDIENIDAFNNDYIDNITNGNNIIPNTCKYYNIDAYNCLPSNGLSLFHHNIRSLNKNFDEINTFMSLLGNNFSVIGFTETWFNDIISPLINIDNYTMIEKHRDNKKGGGVCLFVNNDLVFKQRLDISFFNNSLESLFIEVTLPHNKGTFITGVIYRPPNSAINDFYNGLQNILSIILQRNCKCYIMGDYNIDLKDQQKSTDFLNLIHSNGFFPTITKPTRISSTAETLIDNIITNVHSNITTGVLVTDISDHFPIFLHAITPKPYNDEPANLRNYNKNSIRRFVANMESKTWDTVLDHTDANKAYDSFYDCINTTYNECFPKRFISKTKLRKKKHPWITRGILTSIKRKNKLYKHYIKNPTDVNKALYTTYRNKLTAVIRLSKRSHFNNKFHDARNNPRNTWNTINEILHKGRKKSSYPAAFKHGDQEIDNDTDIANTFNTFFVNLGPSLAKEINYKGSHNDFMHSDIYSHSIFTYPVYKEELIKVATSCLKPNKAAGYDEFKPGIIRHIIPFIAKPLTHICNLSFNTGIFPNNLKIAKVIPSFKEGEKDQYKNYRPISLLSCFSKIVERLMFNRVFNFLGKYDILCNPQYGFRPGHSTELALADAIDKLYCSLDNKKTCIGVFLDLSKAFDTIDHTILLSKLHHYGIRGTTLNWMDSYISNRFQYTSYKNTHSRLAQTQCGVPQGSILGPLLFILYINDICHVSKVANMTLYADDTNIFFESNVSDCSFHTKISFELNKFNDWFAANKLSLNIGKTKYIAFNTSRNFIWDKDIVMGGKILNQVYTTKFLGVHIDNKLSWREHIYKVCRKSAGSIGVISRLKYIVPQRILKTLYQTLVVPRISYCSIVWSGTYESNLFPLIVLQKNVIRHISHAAPREHTNPLFKNLNLLKVTDIIHVNLATFTYKAWNGLLPNAFHNFLIRNRELHHHNTRHADNAHCFPFKTTIGRFRLKNRAINTWNSITENIKTKLSSKIFKKHLIKEVISHY